MYRNIIWLVMTAFIAVTVLNACTQKSNGDIECPSYSFTTTSSGKSISPDDIQKIDGILGDAPRENSVLEARGYLTQTYPDVSNAMAVNYFASHYCKIVSDDPDLSRTEKIYRVREWNGIVTKSIMGDDGAPLPEQERER